MSREEAIYTNIEVQKKCNVHVYVAANSIFICPFDKRGVLCYASLHSSVCPGEHPRFRGYFKHNYEVFWSLFRLKYIRLAPKPPK